MTEMPYKRLLNSVSKRWFILRHGFSEANQGKVIASQPATANDAYGLTLQGQQDVENSVPNFREQLFSKGAPLLLCSPLLRTKETAAIAGRCLGIEPKVDQRLRERDFGALELKDDSHYEDVWQLDSKTPAKLPWQVETVYQVMDRLCALVKEVENTEDVDTCILVTHCDVAMILSCAFQNIDPQHHRSLSPIQTAEVRRLEWVDKISVL